MEREGAAGSRPVAAACCRKYHSKMSKKQAVTIQELEGLKEYSGPRPAWGAEAPAEIGGAAGDPDAAGARGNRNARRGAKGQGEGGGAVAMAISVVRRALADLTGLGDSTLDGVKVFANF